MPLAWTSLIVFVATRRRPLFGVLNPSAMLGTAGHAGAFFVLALLILWSLARLPRRAGWATQAVAAFLAAGVIAAGSELAQSLIPTRGGRLDDFTVDLLGAGAGIAVVGIARALRRVVKGWPNRQGTTLRDPAIEDPGPRKQS